MSEKTNKLRVKKIDLDKGKIVIHDEIENKKRHPIIAFFLRNKLLLLLLIIISLMIFVLGLQLALSSINGVTDPNDLLTTLQMEFHDGTGDVNINGTIPFTNKKAKYNLYKKYGNIGLKDGVIFEVKTLTIGNKKVTYYSDGSAKIVNNNGSIIRVSALDNGSYGVDDKGNITNNKRVNIRIEKNVKLKDGTVIVYYSDGSAEITNDGNIIFARDGSNIQISKNNGYILKINPSGISFSKNTETFNNGVVEYYSDGTRKVTINGDEYIVRNDKDISVIEKQITFPNNNAAGLLETKTLDDGNVIKYYSDGSAEIIKKDGEKLLVRQSGDIIFRDNKLKEVIQDEIGNRIDIISTSAGDIINVFDNGEAVIEYSNGKKEYIKDNSSIKYDDNGNIKDVEGNKNEILKEVNLSNREKIIIYEDGDAVIEYKSGKKEYVFDYDNIKYNKNKVIKINGESIEEKQIKTLPDGTEVIKFTDNIYEVVEPDGNRYIINNGNILHDEDGNIEKIDTDDINDVSISTLPDGTEVIKFENNKYMIETSDHAIITGESNINYSEDGNIDNVDSGLVEDMKDAELTNETLDEITITNPTNKDLKYRLVIEETDDYSKYNMKNLPANYVKYLISVDYNANDEKYLDNNVWTIDDILEGGLKIEKNTYILYEGTIKAKSSVNIDLNLWIDYTDLTNEYQKSIFVGTIKTYAWIEKDAS